MNDRVAIVTGASPGLGSTCAERLVAALPTRTPIEPTEIADLVAFLAAPTNLSLAGENIVVSGAAVIV